MSRADEIDFRIHGQEMQFVEVELDPGASEVLQFELDRRALAYYEPDAADWVVDPGSFEIRVGASSRDIRARATFEVAEA